MRKTKQLAPVVLLIAAIAASPAVPRAAHVTDACTSELNAVEAAIDDAVFLGNNASTAKANLLAKLDQAAVKLWLNKFADAIDKLQDISDNAAALADAPKPKLEDASGINAAVATAINCVSAL